MDKKPEKVPKTERLTRTSPIYTYLKPQRRFELPTYRLQGDRTTAVLLRHDRILYEC